MPLKGSWLCLSILAPRKRVYKFLDAYLVGYLVFLQLVLYVSFNRFFVSSYCKHGSLQEGHGLRSHAGDIGRELSTARSCVGTVFHSPDHSLGILSTCWDIKEDAHLR